MKPWNIILFFSICLQLAAYVVANVVAMPENVNYEYNQYATEYGAPLVDKYNISRTGSDFASGDTSVGTITDYISTGVFMASAVAFILGALASIVWVYPLLVGVLHLHEFWASIIQVMIYFIYAIGFFSWVSGKHPDGTL